MAGYPIDLDVQGTIAVVVGLGAVGRRKAFGLIAAGASVRGVDPRGADWAADLGIDLKTEPYQPVHLDGAKLVLAAAAPEVNQRVVGDAHRLGIWVASASDPKAGDFTVPAVWRSGPLTLTVSTGGASPALASALRDRAATALGPAAGPLAALLGEIRAEVMARVADPQARRLALRQVADLAWLDLLTHDGEAATRQAIRQVLGLPSTSRS